MNMKAIFSLICGGALAIPSLQAGTFLSPETPSPPPETSSDSGWWFNVSLNSWITALEGDVGFRGITADAGMSFSDTLDQLDLAYLTHLEFGKGRWGFALDGIYAKLSDRATFERGPISGSLDLEIEQAFVGARVQYKVIDETDYSLELFAGVRWNYIAYDTHIHTALSFDRPLLQRFNRERDRQRRFTEDWFDPIVGARGIVNMTDQCYLLIAGEVGGFGVGSEFTWQAVVGLGYHFNAHVATLVGYRALGIDYEENDFKMDTVSHGPSVSLIFKF